MKVKELIEELKKLDQDRKVVVRGYEEGVNDVTAIVECRINEDQNDRWYEGQHAVVYPNCEFEEYHTRHKELPLAYEIEGYNKKANRR